MKRLAIIVLVLAAVATFLGCLFCVAATGWIKGNSLHGSGKIATRTVALPAFDGISASRAVKVRLTDDRSDRITIAADDNVLDLVTVEVDGGTLCIGIDKKVKSVSSIDVTVSVPTDGRIRLLDASSAANIASDVLLDTDRLEVDASSASVIEAQAKAGACDVDASSAARIDLHLTAETCSVDASSASKIYLAGSADRCRVDMSSASKLEASDFVVGAYEIEVSSAAKAEVNCTRMLDASASSGAGVRYKGDCEARVDRSSGGSVRPQ